MITLLIFILVYLALAVAAGVYSIRRGPYEEWDGNFLVPVAIVMLWPVALPWYVRKEPLNK